MAQRLDFEALWPFELGQFGTSKGNAPCIFEVVSFLDTGVINDTPECVSDVLLDFIQPVHDAMPDAERQRLKRFIPRLLNCADEKMEAARSRWLVLKAITNFLPPALKAGGFREAAECVRVCEPFLKMSCSGVLPTVCEMTEGIPLLGECTEAALAAYEVMDGGNASYAAAELAIRVMVLNDAPARRLMLREDGPKPIELGKVADIDDAIIKTIDAALNLGNQGADLDPWVVLEAAERFREVIHKGIG
jgi:hypothetical protein